MQLIFALQQTSRNWNLRLASCLTFYLPCCQLSLKHLPLLSSEIIFPIFHVASLLLQTFLPFPFPCWVCLASAGLSEVSRQRMLLSLIPLKGEVKLCSSVGDL